jgi:hypothetical protein
MTDVDVIRAEIAFWGIAVGSGNCSGRGYRAVLPKRSTRKDVQQDRRALRRTRKAQARTAGSQQEEAQRPAVVSKPLPDTKGRVSESDLWPKRPRRGGRRGRQTSGEVFSPDWGGGFGVPGSLQNLAQAVSCAPSRSREGSGADQG